MIWAPLFSELSQLFGVSLLKNSGKRNKFNNTFFFTQLGRYFFPKKKKKRKKTRTKNGIRKEKFHSKWSLLYNNEGYQLPFVFMSRNKLKEKQQERRTRRETCRTVATSFRSISHRCWAETTCLLAPNILIYIFFFSLLWSFPLMPYILYTVYIFIDDFRRDRGHPDENLFWVFSFFLSFFFLPPSKMITWPRRQTSIHFSPLVPFCFLDISWWFMIYFVDFEFGGGNSFFRIAAATCQQPKFSLWKRSDCSDCSFWISVCLSVCLFVSIPTPADETVLLLFPALQQQSARFFSSFFGWSDRESGGKR